VARNPVGMRPLKRLGSDAFTDTRYAGPCDSEAPVRRSGVIAALSVN